MAETELGSVLEIDERTVLVLGQDLDVAAGQPDVANALVHRAGEVVVVVDTGVTGEFRDALRAALDRVGPWTRLVLLTTHGHPDHVGNDDLIDELADQRSISAEHWFPAADQEQMRDPQAYWAGAFAPLAGLAALPAAPALVAMKIVSLFQPYAPFTRRSRPYEDLPLETIELGSQRLLGWTFADGAVAVWRSQGHCAGHVLVLLRDVGLLHLGDEANGPCAVMPDADQAKLTGAHQQVARLISDGVVHRVTDGHSFRVFSADEATERLDGLVEQSAAIQRAATEATGGAGVVAAPAFVDKISAAYRESGVASTNPNPAFTGMLAANLLRGLGYKPNRLDGSRWQRPDLDRRPHAVENAARGLSGVLATVGWIARGRAR